MIVSTLDLRPEHLEAVRLILSRHVPGATVWAFGSRIRGTAKPHSDLDLAIRDLVSKDSDRLILLKDAFSESDLPMKVDIVDLDSISPEFRALIEAQYIPLQES